MTKEEIQKKIDELKKKKAEIEDTAGRQDVFQHAFKIFLNSVYGFTGTQYSPVFSKDLAESVTLTGQTVIKEMVRFTNKCLNKIGKTPDDSEWVIAGDTDSVTGDSKIFLNHKDVTIKDAFEAVADRGYIDHLQNGTEVAVPTLDTFITLGLNGLQMIKNISKHKVQKKIFEVKAPGKEPLKLTEDESLMVYRDGKIIECKPNELRRGDKLIVKNH